MKKLLIGLIAALLIPTGVGAATFYVATNGSDSNSCTQAQSTSTPKRNIMGGSGGLACLRAGTGDRLEIRTGTYNESLDTNSQAFPSGTSYANAATIAAFSGETVTIRSINIVAGQYRIFERLTVDGNLSSVLNELVGIGGNSHHTRLVNMDVKNATSGDLVNLNANSSFNEILGGTYHDASKSIVVQNTSGGYGFYVLGSDNLIAGIDLRNCSGYGIHNFNNSPGTPLPSRNVYRNNRIHGMVGGGGVTVGNGILLGSGDSNQAYNNVIYGNTGDGIQVSNGATNTKVYNNTIYNNNSSGLGYGGLVWGTGSGTTIKNNILYQNRVADFADSNGAQTPTFGNNFCTFARTGCAKVGNPFFLSPAGNDFHLTSGSTGAIDQGATLAEVSSDFDGIARPEGVAPDLGAYEYRAATSVAPTPPSNLRVTQ